MSATLNYTKKDFGNDHMVRWCPGCGDYSILNTVQTAFAKMNIPKENFAVISGIGCSSRFPYYMGTYGFHTIHGRAPAIASGLKATRPELSVWVITGDGDCMSIGGNHFIHTLRRNMDINILLFNNRIYGLTKGQYSPTSEMGKKTKTSPMGSIDYPFNPLTLALGAGGTFVARSVDIMGPHLQGILMQSEQHKGTAFVEIFQNCVIFNDGVFDPVREKKARDGNLLELVAGQPMYVGSDKKRGMIMEGARLQVVDIDDTHTEADLCVHDPANANQAMALAMLEYPEPTPIGVLYQSEKPSYDSMFTQQVDTARERLGWGDLKNLVHGRDSWQVK